MKRTRLASALGLSSLIVRPAPAPVRYPPVLHVPRCGHCGKPHPIAIVCPERAWNLLQQQQGKTP
jgi:hypothetical protein